MGIIISGIQQIGIGIPNVHQAFNWYKDHFGMNVKIFEEAANAALMLPYTQNEVRSRHAILSMNLKGGSGFEIWQYTSRTPVMPDFTPAVGDLGMNTCKVRSYDVAKTYEIFRSQGVQILGELTIDPNGSPTFYLKDPWENVFQMVEDSYVFKNWEWHTGGPMGCSLGVSDIKVSIDFFQSILGYDQVVWEKEGFFEDIRGLNGGSEKYRRVLLRHSKPRKGPFCRLIGPSEIELIQALERTPRKIFKGRDWGDRGYIHLCFDINGMDQLKEICESKGHPFTVDSANSFDMGEAAGRFSYIEDPDGTLIEFVETHKLPVLKKIGWYKNLKNRNPEKPLPDWMLKAMWLNREK